MVCREKILFSNIFRSIDSINLLVGCQNDLWVDPKRTLGPRSCFLHRNLVSIREWDLLVINFSNNLFLVLCVCRSNSYGTWPTISCDHIWVSCPKKRNNCNNSVVFALGRDVPRTAHRGCKANQISRAEDWISVGKMRPLLSRVCSDMHHLAFDLGPEVTVTPIRTRR